VAVSAGAGARCYPAPPGLGATHSVRWGGERELVLHALPGGGEGEGGGRIDVGASHLLRVIIVNILALTFPRVLISSNHMQRGRWNLGVSAGRTACNIRSRVREAFPEAFRFRRRQISPRLNFDRHKCRPTHQALCEAAGQECENRPLMLSQSTQYYMCMQVYIFTRFQEI